MAKATENKRESENDVSDNTLKTENDVVPAAEKTAKNIEALYSAADLANAARAKFKVSPEVVTAALKSAKKDKATVTEAEKIIKEFMKKEIK